MRSSSIARLVVPVAIVLAASAAGCGGGAVSSEEVASASSAATRAPVAQSSHGLLKLVGVALGDVPLAPAQRSDIEQLAQGVEAGHAAARAARHDLVVALASQVQAGTIDRAALQPKVDALAAAINASQPADRAAFERLHAILGPDQRVAFVDAFEAHAHDRVDHERAKHPLRQWAEDLKLTADQRAQIRDALGRAREGGDGGGPGAGDHPGRGEGARAWAESRAQRAKVVLQAFKQDRFVFDEVAPVRDVGALATRASERFLRLAETVVPLLTPEQRAIAAQKLLAHADDAETEPPAPVP